MFLLKTPHQLASRIPSAARALKSRAMSASLQEPLLLSPAQLHDLPANQIALLDATWFMPNVARNAKHEFLNKRLPNARFLDLDQVASEHELGLKHMMPSPSVFAEACGSLGISPSTHVILYDTHGVFSSPRALFMFRAFGHNKSSVLDGGLPGWQAQGLPIETSNHLEVTVQAAYPVPTLDVASIRGYEQMVSNANSEVSSDNVAELVVDARPAGRFAGRDPEPRPGLSSGHIPHSFSLPFITFLQSQSAANGGSYTTFRPTGDIRQALVQAMGEENTDKVLKGQKALITTCGSGMTAAVLWLGLRLLGANNLALYDESWTGYAMRSASKIEKN